MRLAFLFSTHGKPSECDWETGGNVNITIGFYGAVLIEVNFFFKYFSLLFGYVVFYIVTAIFYYPFSV